MGGWSEDINPRGGDGPGSGFGCFLNFGGVFVKNLNTEAFDGTSAKNVLNYVRYLDLDKGIGGVNFSDKPARSTPVAISPLLPTA